MGIIRLVEYERALVRCHDVFQIDKRIWPAISLERLQALRDPVVNVAKAMSRLATKIAEIFIEKANSKIADL